MIMTAEHIGAESIRVMHPLYHAGQGGSIPTSALDLTIERIDLARARALNRLWHSILPSIDTGCIVKQPYPCFAATHAGIIYSVAIWSNPIARHLPQHSWLELRRMAIAPDAPRNTGSRMLAIMRRLLRNDYPHIERIISYASASVHTGAIYRADGWVEAARSRPDTWARPGRSRPESKQQDARIRYERTLH